MTVSEEFVTIELASYLQKDGWRVISVHPPGGQGPFVIPKEATDRSIERGSFHPDVVAIRRERGVSRVLLAEVKPTPRELDADVVKLKRLAQSRSALLFVLFRCQTFDGGPADGVDFDQYQSSVSDTLPIDFMVASEGDSFCLQHRDDLLPYRLTEIRFPFAHSNRTGLVTTHE
jgi:hypothetical protein